MLSVVLSAFEVGKNYRDGKYDRQRHCNGCHPLD
jgi:hypothetical protein